MRAFTVLNLFIGIIVNAMQEEHAKAKADERELIHDETAPLMREIKGLKAEIASLRADLGAGKRP
jgi:voltage-gated sodium channel